MRKPLILILLLALATTAAAQADRSLLRDGNRSYNNKKYDEAEVNYRRALEKDSADFRGQYNLASALYREKKYDEAARHFEQALTVPELSQHRRARTLHNQGNSLLQAGIEAAQAEQGLPQGIEYFGQAVKAYQESLKLEPKDDDTRYNLALARRLLQQAQQQQQQQQQGGGSNQKQQDQKQNQQQQGGDQNQQQNQQQQNQNQQGNQQQQQTQEGREQQQQHQQAKPTDQRRQDAERMLEAVKNNERQTLKEQTRKEQNGTVRHSDKDW